MVVARLIGARVKRKEDPRLITGSGTYVDDLAPTGLLHVAFVRSPHAHARIRSVDASVARTLPGVHAVVTGEDLAHLPPIPIWGEVSRMKRMPHPALTRGEVCYVGEPVAAVVAADPYLARDAAAAVDVDWEPLDAVVDPERALQPDAPRVHSDLPDNLVYRNFRERGDPDGAFASADVVVSERMVNQRLAPVSLEPRGLVAEYEPSTGQLTVWYSHQAPHLARHFLAQIFGISEAKIRIIAPDVGGGFGSKIALYPDEVATIALAIRLGRPLKWIETRGESLTVTSHGRDQVAYVEAAARSDGTVLALRWRVLADLGAYTGLATAEIPLLTRNMMTGVYAVQNVRCEVLGVFTNKQASTAYRGAGRPEAAYYVERLMDLVADATGVDPAEVRRRNFIPPDAFPYRTPITYTYDSGDYARALDRALELAGYDQLRREQEAARRQGRLVGIGLSTFTEVCGFGTSKGSELGGWEVATVRAERDGRVTVLTGASPHGQGLETALAQIVAEQLGVSFDDVVVLHGDTELVHGTMGTQGSRSLALAGSAAYQAAEQVRAKALRIAAFLLEASPDDVELGDGRYRVRGAPKRSVSFAEIAHAAYSFAKLPPDQFEPGLEATRYFEPPDLVFPFGAHVALVEVDPDTGRVDLQRYVAVHDCGVVLNPLLVEGQVHGGLAQGIAQALYEEVVFDQSGQLLTGTLADYAVPTAEMLPAFEIDQTVTPTPHNPLGVKGIGELATIGSTPAVANAVVDALSPLGIRHLDLPLKPERVWTALHEARRSG